MSSNDPSACSVSRGGGPFVRGGLAARRGSRASGSVYRLQPRHVGTSGRSPRKHHLGDRSNRGRLSLAGYGRRPGSIRWRPVRSVGGARAPPAVQRRRSRGGDLPGRECLVRVRRSGRRGPSAKRPDTALRPPRGAGGRRRHDAVRASRRHPLGWKPPRTVQPGRRTLGTARGWAAGGPCPHSLCRPERRLSRRHGGGHVPSKSRTEAFRAGGHTFRGRSGHQPGPLGHTLGKRSDCGFSKASRPWVDRAVDGESARYRSSCTIVRGTCGLERLEGACGACGLVRRIKPRPSRRRRPSRRSR